MQPRPRRRIEIDKQLPEDIRAALRETAKVWLLNNYAGGLKRLDPWSDHYAHLTSVYSFTVPGKPRANLRRLVSLAKEGVLVEVPKRRVGAVREFKATPAIHDAIGIEAQRYWEAVGYRVGELVPTITETAPKEAP